jgi:hypothetical protein
VRSAIGYFSGMVTRSAITTWYPTLIKPSFNPPNWIFATEYVICNDGCCRFGLGPHYRVEFVKKSVDFQFNWL